MNASEMETSEIVRALEEIDNPAIAIVIRRYKYCLENADAYTDIDKAYSGRYLQAAILVVPILRALYDEYVKGEER